MAQTLVIEGEKISIEEFEGQRYKELFERGKLQQNFEDSEIRKMEDTNRLLVENLSVADRLMRRVEHVTFKSYFLDDVGDICIKTRLMTSTERFRAFSLYKKFGELKDNRSTENYQKVLTKMKELAAEVTVTPGMSAYFKSKKVSDDVIIVLIINSLFGSIEAVGNQIRSFRKK